MLILIAWIFSFVYEQIEKKRMDRFIQFCNENGQRLLNGEGCEFEGKIYYSHTRLIRYQWCISIIIITLTRGSSFHAEEDKAAPLILSNLITLFGGWWGIPWGPIRSVQCFIENFKAEKDAVTVEAFLQPLNYTNINN